MIKKVIHPDVLSGVSSPLLPLIYADLEFNNAETDGVYVQTDTKDEIITVFSLKNGCVTLTKSKFFVDSEELEEFFSFLSVDSCLSDADVFGNNSKNLPLLKCEINEKKQSDALKLDEYSRLCEYESVYNLLSGNGENFPQWFSVASKKINSKKAVVVYRNENSIPVSVAMATAVYKGTAIVSGVFTLLDCRKKGYASQCVSALLSELYDMGVKSVYLWCEEDIVPFYEKIGFKKDGNVFVREVF